MVRAPACLGVVVADLDDANLAVLGRSALIDVEAEGGVGVRSIHHQLLDPRIRLDDLVRPVLDGVEDLPGESRVVGDVQPRVACALVRAGLPNMGAEDLSGGAADDMDRRVVVHQLLAALPVDNPPG